MQHKITKALAISTLSLITYLYYTYTESMGLYINWGYLTETQRTYYIFAWIGWIVIVSIWFLSLYIITNDGSD